MKSIDELNTLWELLSDIETDGLDCIETRFLHFEVGTFREDIWHWFEDMNPKFSVGQKMNGIPFDL